MTQVNHLSLWDQNKETLVNKALTEHFENDGIDSISAGYNIMRYAQKGVIGSSDSQANEILKRYSEFGESADAYKVLRLAKSGKLCFKEV